MTTPPVDPFHPQVTGFDLPDIASLPDRMRTVVALLDGPPARGWVVQFAVLADEFKATHNLSDLRMVGRNLTLVGPIPDARALTANVRALIHRISRRGLQQRMTEASESRPVAASTAEPRALPDLALLRDLEAIAAIPAVPMLLEAVTRATGMRFAAIARVTDDRWTACAVYDLIDFGLKAGQDLVLESTICNEIRQHRTTVAFDQASTHPVFAGHPTPAQYGFESYISVPINRPDGSFFGTLCALDPDPAMLDDATVASLELFADMIGRQLAPALPAG
jgi:GAF domain-containing protein